MKLARIKLRKTNSLVILWNKNKNIIWSFDKKEKRVKEISSLDEVRPKEYGKFILVLGRDLYIFKIFELPKFKKTTIDKAIRTNIGEWSPFRNNKYFSFSYPEDNKIISLISILKQEDYDEIVNQLRLKGIKIDIVIPESLCYYNFFKESINTVGVIKKESGVELIYFHHGIKESQFIPIQKWNPDSFTYFIKRIGPEGLDLKEVLCIGIKEDENFFSPEDYSIKLIKTENEIDAILKGSDFFSSSLIKHFEKERLTVFNKEDLKYLKPGFIIIFLGILLFFSSTLYYSLKKVSYLKKESLSLKEKTSGLEEKIDRTSNLKRKVDFVLENVEKYPSQLFVLLELQRHFPEETYLQRYSFHKNKIEFTGISSKSSEIISMLNTSKFFKNIKFISSIEKDRLTGKEKFSIALSLKE